MNNRGDEESDKGEDIMKKKTIIIGLPSGLEAEPVAMLVQIACDYESVIHIESRGRQMNAKSIMGMMTLGLGSGEAITVIAEGPDEDAAVCEIEQYLS